MDLFKITMAIPNGSLLLPTLEILKRSGIEVPYSDRSFEYEIEGSDVIGSIRIFRPQLIPLAIYRGAADVGITGWDCVKEARMEKRLQRICELPYSKRTRKPVRIVLFARKDSKFSGGVIDGEDVTVVSEYPVLTAGLFRSADVVFSHGTTESAVSSGLCDYGVGVTETGESLKKSNLVIVKTILESPVVMMAKRRTEGLTYLGDMFKGALASEEYRLVKANIDGRNRGSFLVLIKEIVGEKANPTVNDLADGSLAIEVVCHRNSLAKMVLRLRMEGASNIITGQVQMIM